MEPDGKPEFSSNTNTEIISLSEVTVRTHKSLTRRDTSSDDTIQIVPLPFMIESNPNIIQTCCISNGVSQSFSEPNETSNASQPTSALMTPKSIITTQPQTLFIQALSKLNENSLNLNLINNLSKIAVQPQNHKNKMDNIYQKSIELSPPDSLMSAPPSYSFVLRQMAAHRRPRLMGTFIPSPSFVQHTPPPNYDTAFDIYIDNPITPPPPRVYNFSFASIPVMCPECGYTGMTRVISKITLCTHLCAFILCIFLCWICVPLPYVLRSCKNVYHYCRNCRNFLGMYCPTSADNSYR